MPVKDPDFMALLRQIREASNDPEAVKMIEAAMKPSQPLQLTLPPVEAPEMTVEMVMLTVVLRASLEWERQLRKHKRRDAPAFADVFLSVLDDRMARPVNVPGADPATADRCRAQAVLVANAWNRISDAPLSERFEERLARRTQARKMGAFRLKSG